MSIPFYITTGKGTTLTRVVDSNNVYSLSTFTGMPVKLSVLQDDIPSSYKKDFIIFEINDNFVLKGMIKNIIFLYQVFIKLNFIPLMKTGKLLVVLLLILLPITILQTL